MGLFRDLAAFVVLVGSFQVLSASGVVDKYEPMVAFICGRPAMHRGVNNWVPDKNQDCPDRLEDVLSYCKTVYPDHNITNVVEASYLVDIPNWPMGTAERSHPHHVRPFRCLVGGFQSDALLVPQHCEFDHRHNIDTCEGFSHWNVIADENCAGKGMHLESLGMLLNCNIGKFNGVEYVCCPNLTDTRYHEPQPDDKPDEWNKTPSSKDSDEDEEEEDEDSSLDSSSSEVLDENVVDLYEAYLRGQDFPLKYNNEHKKYLAAKERMKKIGKQRITKLLQEWQKTRERVNEVRKTDPAAADRMNKEIADRFQRLYASYEQENAAEKQQLSALHQQHIQAGLNEKKRTAMDKFIKALEDGNLEKIAKYLRAYIKAEEKDRMHTVNHFEHIKYASPREALRIRPHIINHLKLSERRIDQALEMLRRFPSVETKIRPEIEEFMKRFNAIATSIKNVVIPVPEVDDSYDTSDSQDEDSSDDSSDSGIDIDNVVPTGDNENVDEEGDDISEDEHDYERRNKFVANSLSNTQNVQQGLESPISSTGQIGSTIGIALGSVSVFVIIVVAIIMIRRKNPRPSVSHGYVEVDPSASPEERHLTNMQMNGYENPTYKYFEVQNNPKA